MSDYKPHVVIDEQKNIILPEALKNHMVQYDHNVKTITFDCPRYSDGRDLSTMRIYVNYFRTSGEKDADRCENITVDSKDNNLIHFEWAPKRSATLEQGILAFLICAEKEDAGGNQENAWHTKLCKDLKIAEGIDCLNAVIEKYPTIITYLLTRMEDVESIATPEAMQAYVNQYLRDYPPSGMTEEERALLEENFALTKQIQEDLASTIQSKADAIICETEGTTIVATDSSDAGFEGLSLYGKSKQEITKGLNTVSPYVDSGGESSGITWTRNNGVITLSGTCIATGAVIDIGVTKKDFTNGFYKYVFEGTISGNVCIQYNYADALCGVSKAEETGGISIAIETGKNIRLFMYEGLTINGTVKTMLSDVDLSDELYEPYTNCKPSPNPEYPQEVVSVGDGGSVEGKVCGKNLINPSLLKINVKTVTNKVITDTGVTFTVDVSEGSSAHGVYNTNDVEVELGKIYTISCDVKVSSAENFKTFYLGNSGVQKKITTSEFVVGKFTRCTMPVTCKNTVFSFYFDCRGYESGNDFDVEIKNIQIEEGEVDTTYEPYKEQTITLQTPNGLSGIPLGTTIPDVIKNSPIHMAGVYWDYNEGQYYIADTKNENGKNVQRILYDNVCAGNVSISGDSNWYDSEKSYSYEIKYYTNGDNTFLAGVIGLCTHFKAYTFNDFYYKSIESGIMNNQPYVVVNIPKELGICTTIDEFKTWCTENDVKIAKVLATPIETPLSDEEIAAYKALHTNKPTTTIMNSENVYMKARYVADTENHIKQNYIPLSKYTALEERVAAIEELVISQEDEYV